MVHVKTLNGIQCIVVWIAGRPVRSGTWACRWLFAELLLMAHGHAILGVTLVVLSISSVAPLGLVEGARERLDRVRVPRNWAPRRACRRRDARPG